MAHEASREVAPPKRVRKCWQVTIHAFGTTIASHVYAPTRSKAMAEVYRNLSDAWCDFTFKDLLKYARVARASWLDVVIPDRHPLSAQLSPLVLHCVTHAYGGTGLKAGYRDHFYACATDWVMQAAYYHGLFRRARIDRGRNGAPDMVMYELTTLGKNVARGEAETYPAF